MLTERERLILQIIIDNFVETAHPIGSRALAKNRVINLSAATIRNVMADLEEMQLLEKMHTSSGRIPSEKGYRYYVDHVISPQKRKREKEISVIKHILHDNIIELEQVAQLSAEVLSQLTKYTVVILGPDEADATLKQVQLISLTPQTAVAILVTSTGHVEHKYFSVPQQIKVNELEKIVNILNDRLVGVPIINLAQALENEVYELMKMHIKDYEILFEYLKAVICYEDTTKLYVGGQANLLTQPEFKDVDKLYDFYTLLEDEVELVNLLSKQTNGLNITIGNENQMDAVKHLSLITTNFHFSPEQIGTIALIGPTRMKYREVISMLQVLSKELTELFTQRS